MESLPTREPSQASEAPPPALPVNPPVRTVVVGGGRVHNGSRSAHEALERVVALCEEIKEMPPAATPHPHQDKPRAAAAVAADSTRIKLLAVAQNQTLQCSDITASALQLLLEALGEQIKRVEGKSHRILQMYPASHREPSAKERLERCRHMRASELPDLSLSLQRHEALLQTTQSSIRQTRIHLAQLDGSASLDDASRSDPRGEVAEQTVKTLATLIENLASLESTTKSMLLLITALEADLDESYTHLSQQQQLSQALTSSSSSRLSQALPHQSLPLPSSPSFIPPIPVTSFESGSAAPSPAHHPPPDSPRSSVFCSYTCDTVSSICSLPACTSLSSTLENQYLLCITPKEKNFLSRALYLYRARFEIFSEQGADHLFLKQPRAEGVKRRVNMSSAPPDVRTFEVPAFF